MRQAAKKVIFLTGPIATTHPRGKLVFHGFLLTLRYLRPAVQVQPGFEGNPSPERFFKKSRWFRCCEDR